MIRRFARFAVGRVARTDPVFKRVLIKLSGEALMGPLDYGTDPATVGSIADQLKVGARSRRRDRHRARRGQHLPRALQRPPRAWTARPADYMGMLAIVLNALTLQDALEKRGVHTRVQSAITISEVAEPYIRRRAMRHLEKQRDRDLRRGHRQPVLHAPTRRPRCAAIEMHAEVLLMAKNGVEGIYTADPRKDPDAEFIPEITAREALQRDLKVMDATALALCMENHLNIHVFNMADDSNINRIISGDRVGTLVTT